MSMDRCLRSAKNAPVVSPALPEVRGEVGVGGRGNSRGLPEATTAHLSPLETLPRPDSSLSPHFSLIIIIPPSFGLRTVVHLSDMMPKPRASEGGRERRQLPLASPSLHLRHACVERERERGACCQGSFAISLVHVRPRPRPPMQSSQ